jgi:hypothetical protein
MKAARDPYKKVDNKRYKTRTKGNKQRRKAREQKREWE